MTVAEVIEELKKQPQWARVLLPQVPGAGEEVEIIEQANVGGTVVWLRAA